MHLKKCHKCGKHCNITYVITEVKADNSIGSFELCENCTQNYFGLLDNDSDLLFSEDSINLDKIKTPEQLIEFLNGNLKPDVAIDPCQCGMTEKDLDNNLPIGCEKCYTHFETRIEKILTKYHRATRHVGKKPKNWAENSPVEKLKLLKLQYAKALELEEFEKCGGLKRQIEDVTLLIP